jgi:AGZA family xanthine/uracil permease-like MFS transporter
MLPALIAILGVLAIAILEHKKVKGSILWGILGSTVLYYILLAIAYACGSEGAKDVFAAISIENPFNAFGDWGTQAVGQVFVKGFDFSGFINANSNGVGALIVLLLTTALSLCMIDMFDTIGTLYGACAKGNLLDENGVPLNMNKMMLSDAIATSVGAIAGTSTVTTFVESSSGVAAGGKTGFAALVTAICFIIAMFLSPIAQLIPRSATATALIWVGILMMGSVTKIDWNDASEAIVAFFTFIIMVLGYSISTGIGIGIIVYIIVKLCTGKIKEVSIPTWVIGALFLLTFILT